MTDRKTDTEFRELIERAAAGSEAAWLTLYRMSAPQVRGYLRATSGGDADDLVGEVFLNAARSIRDFHGDERDFKAWLFAIARNRAIDAGRKKARRVDESPAEQLPETPVGDPEGDALTRIATQEVRDLLARLPRAQRDVLLLRIMGDLTIEEVARILKKTPGSVKALQRRALRRLKRSLSDPYP